MVLVIPCNTGYLDPHEYKPSWLYHDPVYALDGGNSISHLLGQAFQGENIHTLPPSIGGAHEVKLGPIIQQAGGELSVNKSLTKVLRAYPMSERIQIQVGGFSVSYLAGAGGAGDAGRGGALALALALGFTLAPTLANLFLVGPFGFGGRCPFFAIGQSRMR